jgi:hypothetical protein
MSLPIRPAYRSSLAIAHEGAPHVSMFQLTERIIGSAIKIHRRLGPGLLESAYESCLAYELDSQD